MNIIKTVHKLKTFPKTVNALDLFEYISLVFNHLVALFENYEIYLPIRKE
jgi:hypothetical protein